MIKEFSNFLKRGNVFDLAVAVILGGAFGAVVKSFVADVIMPPIGLALGGVNFSELYINLSGGAYESLAAAQEAGAATINYGIFLNTIINFAIVAFVVFLMVKSINTSKKAEEEAAPPAPPEPTAEEKLLTEIRDLLKEK